MTKPQNKNRLATWIRPEILSGSAYSVPPARTMIKLDAMENPYTLPPSLQQQWLKHISMSKINRYPDPSLTELKTMLGTEINRSPEQLIFGNGSDELIQMLMLLTAGEGHCVLSLTPSFTMYQVIATITGHKFIGVPLDRNFNLNLDLMLSAIQQHNPACIFIAWPNNPTGNCFDVDAIIEITQTTNGLVIIDEAYHPFCRRSFIDQLDQFENLMVMRTLSKNGLAGLRLGYLASHSDWIEQLEKIRLPYNINCLTQASVAFFLQHIKIFNAQADQINHQRTILYNALSALRGIIAYKSEANFILFKATGLADALFDHLIHHNILLKNMHQPGTPLEDCLRVTIGTTDECTAFLAQTKLFLELAQQLAGEYDHGNMW